LVKAMGHEDKVLFVLAGMGDYHERCRAAAEGLGNVSFQAGSTTSASRR